FLTSRFQHFQESARLYPIRLNADGQLVVLDRLAAAAADITVDVAGIEPARGQEELKLLALLLAQRRFVRRPSRQGRPECAQAIGEMADGQGIAIGIIVMLDRLEIAENEEDRCLTAGGEEQAGAVSGPRIR